MKDILNITYLLVLIVITALIYFVINVSKSNIELRMENGTNEIVGWCGTTSPYDNNSSAQNGKKLFKNNCATCHNKNMKSDATGPALGDTFMAWERDTLSYTSYLNYSYDGIEKRHLKRIVDLKKSFGYPSTFSSHDFKLSLEEVKDIISYIEIE